MIFNYDLLKEFIDKKQVKEKTTLRDILKPIHISEKRFNKILNNEGYFTLKEILHISEELNISNSMIKQVFFNKMEV